MANEVVKYHNSMNDISFKKFSAVELDLFFSICYKLREKGTEEVQITFEEIKKLSKYNRKGTINDFYEYLKSIYDKLIQLNFSYEDDGKYIKFILFTGYEIDKEKQYIDVAINKKFEFVFNELTSNFTRFELEQFTKLRSSYSKQLFKLLSQFNFTGNFIISLDDFKKKLNIPASYKMHNIDSRVLNPILLELKFYFKNLKLEKIKKGRNIDRLKFTFSPRKESILGFKNGNPVTVDERTFEEIQKEKDIKKEFEGLNPSEQVKLIRVQLDKNLL